MFIQAAGGLVLFLWGIQLLSSNLERYAGPVSREWIFRLTGTPWRGFFTGVLVTGILQSSSLTTVMVVGAVNASVLPLGQALGIIIGANVGTTVTAQLLSFNLHKYALFLLVPGFALTFLPWRRAVYAGNTVLSFSLVLLGFNILTGALVPMQDWPVVTSFLQQAGEAPWKGIVAGFFTVALMQSSSAVTGMALAMARQGALALSPAVALLIGADVGTCITALIASIRMRAAARKAALGHLLFNLCSAMLVIPFFRVFVSLAGSTSADISRQLANAHTMYNLLGALVLMPLIPLWVYLLEKSGKKG